MPEVSKELITLLNFLSPGFLAAWVLFGLTSNVKPSPFERVVQAFILTFLIHVTLQPVEFLLSWIGTKVGVLRLWDFSSQAFATILIACLLGCIFAYFINTDLFHRILRKTGLTTSSSYPTEWFGVFSENITYVVLHLTDERRLYGWPKEWPTEAEKGHFFIMQPTWIVGEDENLKSKTIDMVNTTGILINAKDVKWVEFVNQQE
jgi:hypothetical protein